MAQPAFSTDDDAVAILRRMEPVLTRIEQRLTGLEGRTSALEQHVGALEQHVGALEQRVAGVEREQKTLVQAVQDTREQVIRVDAKIDERPTRFQVTAIVATTLTVLTGLATWISLLVLKI